MGHGGSLARYFRLRSRTSPHGFGQVAVGEWLLQEVESVFEDAMVRDGVGRGSPRCRGRQCQADGARPTPPARDRSSLASRRR